MLFHLLYGALGDKIGFLRVFRYTSTRILEFAIAGAAMAYLFYSDVMTPDVRLHLQLPFTNYYESTLELPAWLYVVFGTVVVVGTANAVNFTDGLDGLAIGPSIMNAGT